MKIGLLLPPPPRAEFSQASVRDRRIMISINADRFQDTCSIGGTSDRPRAIDFKEARCGITIIPREI